MLRELRYHVYFDMDQYWPISLFLPKPLVWQDYFSLLSSIITVLAIVRLWIQKASIKSIFPFLLLFIIATNLMQGIPEGFKSPIAGDGTQDHQYWQDTDKITSVGSVLKYYNSLLPTLNMHSRVHPPGPMVFIYALRQIISNPIIINLLIFFLSSLLSFPIYYIAKDQFGEHLAKLTTILYFIMPAISIYYLSTIDALIAGLFIFTLFSWKKRDQGHIWFTACITSTWIISFFTFTVVLLLPVFFLDEYVAKKSIKTSLIIISSLLVAYFFTNFITSYNYLENFITSKKFESSQSGFYLIDYPLSYFITRLEDVLEIILFLGPLLSLALFQSIRNLIKNKANIFKLIPYVSIPTLLILFFIAGAYFTGETSRAALYIFFPLFMLISHYLSQQKITPYQETILIFSVSIQTIIMQAFGWYNW